MPTRISYNLSNGHFAGVGAAGEGMPEDTRGFVYARILSQASSELAAQVHASDGYKAFTISRLIKPRTSAQRSGPPRRDPRTVSQGHNAGGGHDAASGRDPGPAGAHQRGAAPGAGREGGVRSRPGGGDGSSDGRRTLRLTALTTEVADAFFTGLAIYLASGQPIRIGDMLLEVDEERGPVTVHSQAEYSELAEAGPAGMVVLRALSPTTFTDGGRQAPLPVPGVCFGSLARKWNAFAPAEVRIPEAVEEALRESVAVCRHDISTRPVRMRSHVEIGFVGTVGFRLMSRDGGLRRWFGALGRFAEYAGLGAHTTLGMGQIAVVQVGEH